MNILSNKLPSLIKPNELNQLIKSNCPELKILDCTYPAFRGSQIFKKVRIENSVFLDMDSLRDSKSELTMEFPKESEFKETLKRYNINKKNQIICYDQYGMYSSPRAWFIFKAYNFNVSILDGGLPNWINSGLYVDKNQISDEEFSEENYFEKIDCRGEKLIDQEDFEFDKKMLSNFEEVDQIISEYEKSKEIRISDSIIIDTRPEDNFEMYPLPNSLNIPYYKFFNKDYTFKSKEEIKTLFPENLQSDTKIISSCGIGLSACLGVFAFKEVIQHHGEVKLYNGSFEEYSLKK
jgi:thiosulfate/3-mercaptopyruvate sulfurtransferase